MAWPPPVLPVNRSNATPQQDNHPGDHNAVNLAVNDLVAHMLAEVDNNRGFASWTPRSGTNPSSPSQAGFDVDLGALLPLCPYDGTAVVTVNAYVGFAPNAGQVGAALFSNAVASPVSGAWTVVAFPGTTAIGGSAWMATPSMTISVPALVGQKLQVVHRTIYDMAGVYSCGMVAAQWLPVAFITTT